MKSTIGRMMMVMKTFPSKIEEVKMLQFPLLEGYCNISHFTTTRHGGVSQGLYASLNFGRHSGDDIQTVWDNFRILSEAIELPLERIYVPGQVHGCRIVDINESFLNASKVEQQTRIQGTDALITSISDVCVAVSTADCVPVLLYAPDKRIVASIHAGWRGTVQHIGAKAALYIKEQYGADMSLMLAGIGPSIDRDSFEVGEEVVDAFCKAEFDSSIIKRDMKTGKAHIDLWEANRLQLIDVGIKPEHIEVSGISTFTHVGDFFSARRLGKDCGRMLSGIWIKEGK